MPNLVIAATKSWNLDMAQLLQAKLVNYNIHIVTNKQELDARILTQWNPEYVFFPHWSWIIPEEISTNFRCVVFHMTDLPYGRGGSPLQNLISRGVVETKISALAVDAGIDTGAVYLKRPLNLNGGAEEIYIRCAKIIFEEMIPYILENNPTPVQQEGEVTAFTRRTAAMSELSSDMTIEQIFDSIRMLDAQGYPSAFLRFGEYTLRFTRPKRTYNGIVADVVIEENKDVSE